MQRPKKTQLDELLDEKELNENPNFVFCISDDNSPRTLLSYCLGYNPEEKVYEADAKQLLEHGAKVHTECKNDLFRYVFRTGNNEMIQELLSYGAEVNRERNTLGPCLEYFTQVDHFKDIDLNKIKLAWELLLKRPLYILFDYQTHSGLTVLDYAFQVPKEYREIFLPALINAIKSQALGKINTGNIQDKTQLNKFLSVRFTPTSDNEKLNEIAQRIKKPLEQWLNRKDSKNSMVDMAIVDEVKPPIIPQDNMSEDEIKKMWEEAINLSNCYFYQAILSSKQIRDYEASTGFAICLALQKNDVVLLHCLSLTVTYENPKKSVLDVAFNVDTYPEASRISTIMHNMLTYFEIPLPHILRFYDQIEQRYKDSKEQNKQAYHKIKRELITFIQSIVNREFSKLLDNNTFRLNHIEDVLTKNTHQQQIQYRGQDRDLKNNEMKLYKLVVPEGINKDLSQKLMPACTAAILSYLLTNGGSANDHIIKNFTLDQIKKFVEIFLNIALTASIKQRTDVAATYYHFAGKVLFLHFENKPQSMSLLYSLLTYNCFQHEQDLIKTRMEKLVSLGWQIETLCLSSQFSCLQSAIGRVTKTMETLLSQPILPNEVKRFGEHLKGCLDYSSNKRFHVRYFFIQAASLIINKLEGSDWADRIALLDWYKKENTKLKKESPPLSAEYTPVLLNRAIKLCERLLSENNETSALSVDKGDAKSTVNHNTDNQNKKDKVFDFLAEFYLQLILFYLNNKNVDQAIKVSSESFQFVMRLPMNFINVENLLDSIYPLFTIKARQHNSPFKTFLGDFLKLKAACIDETQAEYYCKVESKLWSLLAEAQQESNNFKDAENLFQRALTCITKIKTPTSAELTEVVRLDKAKKECQKKLQLLTPTETRDTVTSIVADTKTIPTSTVDPILEQTIKKGIAKINLEVGHANKFFDGLIFQDLLPHEQNHMKNLYNTCINDWEKLQRENDITKVTPELNVKICELNKKFNAFSERTKQWTDTRPNIESAPKRSMNKGKMKKGHQQTTQTSGTTFQAGDKKNNKSKGKKPTKSGQKKNKKAANARDITFKYENYYKDGKARAQAIEAAKNQVLQPWPQMPKEPSSKIPVKPKAGNGTIPEPSLNSSQSLSSSTLSSSVVTHSLFNPGPTAKTQTEDTTQPTSVDDLKQNQQEASTVAVASGVLTSSKQSPNL